MNVPTGPDGSGSAPPPPPPTPPPPPPPVTGRTFADYMNLMMEWVGSRKKAFSVLSLFGVMLIVLVLGFSLGWFGDDAGSDSGAGADAEQVASDDADGDGADPADETEDQGDGTGSDPPDASDDQEQITYSSLPAHEVYAMIWGNDEMAIELNRDGSYRYVAPGVDTAGRFTMTVVDGQDRILFMDPDDPGGITYTSWMPVSLEDGVLVYGHGDAALDLAPLSELPTMEADYPPVQTLDLEDALDFDGSWNSENPEIQLPNVTSAGVAYTLVPDDLSGSLALDLEAGTISGEVVAEFVCESGRCTNLDTDRASGTATLTFTTGTLTGRPGRWTYEGTVEVDLAWRARTACTDDTCRWPYNTTLEAEYTLRVLEATTNLWLEHEDTTEGGVAVRFRLTTETAFDSG